MCFTGQLFWIYPKHRHHVLHLLCVVYFLQYLHRPMHKSLGACQVRLKMFFLLIELQIIDSWARASHTVLAARAQILEHILVRIF